MEPIDAIHRYSQLMLSIDAKRSNAKSTYAGSYRECLLIEYLLIRNAIVPLQILGVILIEHRTAQGA